jgi:hypothetical protein
VATTSAVQETFGPVVVINTVASIEEAVRRGFGRFHGDEGLREFSYTKSTTPKRVGLGKDLQSFPRTLDQFDAIRKTVRLPYGRSFH